MSEKNENLKRNPWSKPVHPRNGDKWKDENSIMHMFRNGSWKVIG